MPASKKRRTAQCGAAVALLALSGGAFAAWEPDVEPATPEVEGAVPPPPIYATNDLVPITVPQFSTVKVGLDPQSITIDRKAGIVRYVVIVQGPSAFTANYEGLRCKTAEYRIYAHQSRGESWVNNEDGAWRSLNTSSAPSQIAYQLARYGMCVGPGTRDSIRAMVRELKSNNASLYR